jgi:Fanconi anemia group M protein
VWQNLGIQRFEHRGPTDPDVVPYTHAIRVEPIEVPVPTEVRHLGMLLKTVVRRQVEALQRLGHATAPEISRRELLEIGKLLDRQIAAARSRGEPAPGSVWGARTAQAIAMKSNHAVELVETQGVEALRQYLARQHQEGDQRRSPALRGFLADPDVVEVERRLSSLHLEHPKVATAVRLVAEELHGTPGAKVIVFTQYRQTAEQLVKELDKLSDPSVRAVRFVGQASHGSDEGLSQKSQSEILDRFRAGTINCLVATSVAEEGLDIPSTDLVVLYEPVPDEIRTIQRRGRTGRARAGRALVLIASGTRDEGMFRTALAKERRMHEMLEQVQTERLRPGEIPAHRARPAVQKMLTEFPDVAR